jgi:hypothetical protein
MIVRLSYDLVFMQGEIFKNSSKSAGQAMESGARGNQGIWPLTPDL